MEGCRPGPAYALRQSRLTESDRHYLGTAGLFHSDAVEGVGHLHGALVVGDDDELRAAAHLFEETGKARYVGLVERGVHLIEHAEGARLDEERREEQGDRREGPLAAGEERNGLKLLASRLCDDLYAGLKDVRLVKD